MSNFALQVNANSHCAFTSNTGVQNATKLVARIRVLGICLSELTADFGLVEIGSGVDRKLGISANTSGAMNFIHLRTPGSESDTLVIPAVTNTTYYEVEVTFDPSLGSNRAIVTIYDSDGTTVLGTTSGNFNTLTTAMPTTAGAGIGGSGLGRYSSACGRG